MRLRAWIAGLTLVASSAVITPAVLLTDVGVASAAPTCALPAPVGGVITLTGDCDTTVPLMIPDGVTLNGAGFTITAHDVADGSFNGAVVTNAGTSMNVENLTIMGTGFTQTQPIGSCGRAALYGIFFDGASGSVSNVTVTGITEGSNCQVGRAIVGQGTAGQTLTITNTTVSDYNKDAMHTYGMKMNVSGSTIDPPAPLMGITGQNGLVYQDGASGAATNSTIFGSGYGNENNANTAVLLFGATNVTLSGDTITGAETDIGVAVAANSNGIVIDGNQIGRTAPDVTDNFGFGVEVDSRTSTATLNCNTFSGWNTDITGATQTETDCAQPIAPPSEGPFGVGYWLGAADAGVFTFGAANFYGSGANLHLNAPVVGMAITPSGGYWLVGSDGGVFSYDGAGFFGSLGTSPPAVPIVGMAATRDGGGYYLVGSDGSVYPFGDAQSHGSMAGTHLNAPVVGIAVTPNDGGYYLAARDGGVFTFGNANFQGSAGGKPLDKPVVGLAVDDATGGYWLVASDGGVFGYSAPFLGSTGAIHLNAPVVALTARTDGLGYWLVASDGGVFAYGTAPFLGSMGGSHLNKPVVAVASFDAVLIPSP